LAYFTLTVELAGMSVPPQYFDVILSGPQAVKDLARTASETPLRARSFTRLTPGSG
jgi:hypothetical protein